MTSFRKKINMGGSGLYKTGSDDDSMDTFFMIMMKK